MILILCHLALSLNIHAAESIFTERGKTRNVVRESGGRYSDVSKLDLYVKHLETRFRSAMFWCPYSLFIIDEVCFRVIGEIYMSSVVWDVFIGVFVELGSYDGTRAFG